MNLLERIKKLVRGQVGESEQVILDANSTREMLEHLDELITQNEVELRKTRQELARLELSERASIENVKSGRVGDREKEFVLLQIKRTRNQMESLKVKADILNKNIELHLNLVGKIQQMEAMDLRGIEQSLVERVMLDFEEGMEKFREAVHASEGVTQNKQEVLTARDKDELRKLEKEIIGESKVAPERQTQDDELAQIEAELMQAERERKEAAKDLEQKPELE